MSDLRERRIIRQHSQTAAVQYLGVLGGQQNNPGLNRSPDALKELIDWFDQDVFAVKATDAPAETFTQERQVNPPDTLTTTSPSSGREATPKQKGLVRARAVAAGLDEQRLNTILLAQSGQSGLENLQFDSVDGVLQAIGR